MAWAQLTDVRCYYEVSGHGDPPVLVPGLGVTSRIWDNIVPDLAEQFSVIRLDNRGIGRSTALHLAREGADVAISFASRSKEADGVVAEKSFVERLESQAEHSQEVLDEDDAFLGLAATEVWEYDVADGRDQEFRDALVNSQMVIEFEELEDTPA